MNPLRPSLRALGALALLGLATSVDAGDWPQLLGPARDGVARGEAVARAWPDGGPRTLWRAKVGSGWAGPAVAGDTAIIFHRIGDEDIVDALDASTGDKRWTFTYPSNYSDDFGFDPGPRATPTIDAEARRVYTHGAGGMLHCLDLATGKVIWAVDTVRQFGSRKGFFGRAGSPLIEGDVIVLNTGGPGAGIAALDKASGKTVWTAGDDEAGYASPTAATVNGRRLIFAFTRSRLVALDPASGKAELSKPWRSRMDASVNAAVPIVVGDTVFVSTSYNTGAFALRLAPGNPRELWSSDDALSNHYTTSVHHGGQLYGFHGRQEQGAELRCVELATGAVKWTEETRAAGWIIVAGDDLLILTERGELILAPASPAAFKPTARAQVLGFEVRAAPALANGRLYARDKRQVICLDLRAE